MSTYPARYRARYPGRISCAPNVRRRPSKDRNLCNEKENEPEDIKGERKPSTTAWIDQGGSNHHGENHAGNRERQKDEEVNESMCLPHFLSSLRLVFHGRLAPVSAAAEGRRLYAGVIRPVASRIYGGD